MEALAPYLPTQEGYLPKWLLFVSFLSVFNTVQTFSSLTLTRRVYSDSPGSVNGLQSRTFGVWTLVSAIIRFQAAYRIDNKDFYLLAFSTYLLALGHFASEIFVYRTAKLTGGALAPMIVASTSLYWMWTSYSYYVKP